MRSGMSNSPAYVALILAAAAALLSVVNRNGGLDPNTQRLPFADIAQTAAAMAGAIAEYASAIIPP